MSSSVLRTRSIISSTLHCLDVSEMRFVRLDSGLGTPQASIRSNVEFARTADLHEPILPLRRRRLLGTEAPHYLIVSAAALHTNASRSPVPPLQPIAPTSFPPSTRGNPPGDATSPSS